MMTLITNTVRDRENTKNIILKAVGEIIETHGIEEVNVSLISKLAGVNKALIYRYFGGLPGLIEQYFKLYR